MYTQDLGAGLVYGRQLSLFIEFGTQTCAPFSYEHGKV